MGGSKAYPQRYRKSWEQYDCFRRWLRPYPQNETTAYCDVCKVVIKAHMCDLQKHGLTKKHKKAMELCDFLHQHNDSSTSVHEVDENTMDLDPLEFEPPTDYVSRWTSDASIALIETITTHWEFYKTYNVKRNEWWEKISSVLLELGYVFSAEVCARKFRNMKVSYFKTLKRIVLGMRKDFRTEYFDAFHNLYKSEKETVTFIRKFRKCNRTKSTSPKSDPPSDEDEEEEQMDDSLEETHTWNDDAINAFLEILEEFKKVMSHTNADEFWQVVDNSMRDHGFEFKVNEYMEQWSNLIEMYESVKAIRESTGERVTWPYFDLVQSIQEAFSGLDESFVESSENIFSVAIEPVCEADSAADSTHAPTVTSQPKDETWYELKMKLSDPAIRARERNIQRLTNEILLSVIELSAKVHGTAAAPPPEQMTLLVPATLEAIQLDQRL